MIDLNQLLAYMLVAFVMIVIPGPGVLFIVGRALAHGRRTVVATAVGHALGSLLTGALVSFGLGTILQQSVQVFTIVKIAGAAYLVWLGVQAIRTRGKLAEAISDPGEIRGRRSLRDGVVVGLTNPKSYVLFGAVLPQFVNRAAGHVTAQMLILSTVAVLIGMASDVCYGMAASTVRSWFARSPRRLGLVGGIGGLAMIGLGVTLAVTGGRKN